MAHYRHSIKSYDDAERIWTEHEKYIGSIGRHAVVLGYSTYLVDTGDRHPVWRLVDDPVRPINVVDKPVLAVRHHDTNIVTYWPNGQIQVETGGYITVTTLERLQEFTPNNIHVYGEHVQARRKPGYFHFEDGETPLFTLDGATVTGAWL